MFPGRLRYRFIGWRGMELAGQLKTESLIACFGEPIMPEKTEKKEYQRPMLEKRQRLVEVTEGIVAGPGPTVTP